jgi:glycosyltransferase involved in cell wall biosynthesis
MNKRPKIALWFRYGPAEHSELFHAMPAIVEELAQQADVHYFGMKSSRPVPEPIRRNAAIHELPFGVDRSSARDKLLKTLLWVLFLPWVGLHCRLLGIRAVYIDETIPLTALVARLFFGRWVAITVADIFAEIYFTGRIAFLGRFLMAVDSWTWKRLPLIFTRAKSTKQWLAKVGVDPAVVHPVYDPCDLSLYHPLPTGERQAIRTQLGYGPDDLVLVHHGILHPNKGNDRIIGALAQMRDAFPRLRYLLVGDGTEMPRLRKLIEDLKMETTCRLTGWLPTLADVNRHLNAGDVGLVMRTGGTSDDFHMTGALVHNMACGLPLLAARLGGVSEVVEEDRNGLLFDPSDMDEFKAKLARLIQDPHRRMALGKAAEADARIFFDMRSVTEKTVKPLLQLAGIGISEI